MQFLQFFYNSLSLCNWELRNCEWNNLRVAVNTQWSTIVNSPVIFLKEEGFANDVGLIVVCASSPRVWSFLFCSVLPLNSACLPSTTADTVLWLLFIIARGLQILSEHNSSDLF